MAELPLPLADDAKLWSDGALHKSATLSRAGMGGVDRWAVDYFGRPGATEGWRLLMGGGAALLSCVTRLEAQWNDCQARAVPIFCGLGGVWVKGWPACRQGWHRIPRTLAARVDADRIPRHCRETSVRRIAPIFSADTCPMPMLPPVEIAVCLLSAPALLPAIGSRRHS